jgi:hypothetical protein
VDDVKKEEDATQEEKKIKRERKRERCECV